MDEQGFSASCLTDNPVKSAEGDRLRAKDYANALVQFIKNAATPVTIGIQGGWGSGKTSLINVLKEHLDSDPEHGALCVLVNAWEHSRFQAREGRAEVAVSLLSGLSSGLAKKVENASWLDGEARKQILNRNDNIARAIGGIKCGLMFASKVAVQMLSNMVGGGDVSAVKMEEAKNRAAGAIPDMAS